MFTGIIEEIGHVRSMPAAGRAGQLGILAHTVLEDVHLGDSIAVNGVCLTVTTYGSDMFTVDVMPETLSRSSLGQLRIGSPVNLERAMQMGGRFGGHIVSGHIDGTGTIISRTPDQNAIRLRIGCDEHITALIVEKGSICIDGVSLTVSGVFNDGFEVSIIPHTGEATILLDKRAGETVNLENDVVGKYVQRLLGNALGAGADLSAAAEALGLTAGPPGQMTSRHSSGGITMEYLREHGF